MPQVIMDTWQYIWQYCQEHTIQRNFRSDFELFNESKPTEVSIYIGINK